MLRFVTCEGSPYGQTLSPVRRKIRDLVADLEQAGFAFVKVGMGAHRKFRHPRVSGFALLSGKTGADASVYQEKHVAQKLEESR